MTFIIALGIIIILLCSASLLRLIQPNKENFEPSRKPQPAIKKFSSEDKIVQKQMKSLDTAEIQPFIEPVIQKAATDSELIAASQKSLAQPEQIEINVPDLISINLLAEADRPYSGYELLQALLSCGMRFGAMHIFHRHEKKTGIGDIYFSLACCTPEGTFDLSKIGGFSCNGLVLFMKPKTLQDPVKVFEMLLETADQLITDLGGKVLNTRQQLLKKEDVLELHQKLQHYTKYLKTADIS